MEVSVSLSLLGLGKRWRWDVHKLNLYVRGEGRGKPAGFRFSSAVVWGREWDSEAGRKLESWCSPVMVAKGKGFQGFQVFVCLLSSV